ncbi:MAG: phosphatidylglycerophosphatase A [Planctomycetota bacterium]|nr:MAG: phosphatidylglycerophosphatase A [Planctomycetota bacterium]
MAQRIVLFVGSLGYLGFVPVASGTVAVAVVGIPVYLLLTRYLQLSWPAYVSVVAALTLVSIWVADRTDAILNEKDSRRNVIDEIPGFLVALVGLPCTWQVVVAAFLLERAIDIAKVWPANWIERRLPGGWGVVIDDVVAGLYTLAILKAVATYAPSWIGG